MLDQEGLLFLTQVCRRPLSMLQKEILDGPVTDFFQLEK